MKEMLSFVFPFYITYSQESALLKSISLMYYQEKNKSMSFPTWQGVICKYCSWYINPFSSPGDLPNPGIGARSPTLQADSLPCKPPEKPKNTGVVAYPFFRGSSWPRNWTRVCCIVARLFTSWATREAHINPQGFSFPKVTWWFYIS